MVKVLALQETHLTERLVNSLHKYLGRRLEILYSAPPERSTSAQGVAFVLNKDKTNIKDAKLTEITPGRAILLTLPWHKTLVVTILNIYAPNSPSENAKFWQDLDRRWMEMHLEEPDIMLGDFNMVEDTAYPAEKRRKQRWNHLQHSGSI